MKIKIEVVEKLTKNLASSLSGVTLSGVDESNESGSGNVGSPASSKIAMSVDESSSSSVVTSAVIDLSDGDKSSQSIVPYPVMDSSDGEKSSTVESVDSPKVDTRMSGVVPAENLNKENNDSLQTVNSSAEGKDQYNSDSIVAVEDELGVCDPTC